MKRMAESYDYLVREKRRLKEIDMGFSPLITMNTNGYSTNSYVLAKSDPAPKKDYVPPKVTEDEEKKYNDFSRGLEMSVATLPFLRNKATYGEIGYWFNRNFKLFGGFRQETSKGKNDEKLQMFKPYLGFEGKSGNPEYPWGKGIVSTFKIGFPAYSEYVPHASVPDERSSLNANQVELDIYGVGRLKKLPWLGGYFKLGLNNFYASKRNISDHYFERFPVFKEVTPGIYQPDHSPRNIGGLSTTVEAGAKFGGFSLGIEYESSAQKYYYPLAKGHNRYHAVSLTSGFEFRKGIVNINLKPKYTFYTTEPDQDALGGQAYSSKFSMYGRIGFEVSKHVEIFAEGQIADRYPSSLGVGVLFKKGF
ncbi:hypothetical protein ACFL5G_04265 [Candidatus Margulisiibacteriota bacterium]